MKFKNKAKIITNEILKQFNNNNDWRREDIYEKLSDDYYMTSLNYEKIHPYVHSKLMRHDTIYLLDKNYLFDILCNVKFVASNDKLSPKNLYVESKIKIKAKRWFFPEQSDYVNNNINIIKDKLLAIKTITESFNKIEFYDIIHDEGDEPEDI